MVAGAGKEEVNARDLPKMGFAYFDWFVVGRGNEGVENGSDS